MIYCGCPSCKKNQYLLGEISRNIIYKGVEVKVSLFGQANHTWSVVFGFRTSYREVEG